MILQDAGTRAARAWIGQELREIVLSDLTWGEFIATVGREVRSRNISEPEGRQVIATTAKRFDRPAQVLITSEDVRAGTAMVADFSLGLRLPDAIHLAIAGRHGATLVTTDKRQANAAAALGIGYVDPTRLA